MSASLINVRRIMRDTADDGYVSGRLLVGLVPDRPELHRGLIPVGRALHAIGATQAQADKVARLQGWCDAPQVQP